MQMTHDTVVGNVAMDETVVENIAMEDAVVGNVANVSHVGMQEEINKQSHFATV